MTEQADTSKLLYKGWFIELQYRMWFYNNVKNIMNTFVAKKMQTAFSKNETALA